MKTTQLCSASGATIAGSRGNLKKNITEAARVIRSKNSGPFELTLDILLKNKKYFKMFMQKNIVNKKRIASLYKIKENDILDIIYFEPSNAIKVTMRRRMPSGSPGETDIYGAQQHAPLLDIMFEDS